jgi:hypothetical protein
MRYTNLLPLAAAVATAVVIPDEATAQQLSLEIEKPVAKTVSGWWDALRSTAEETVDAINKGAHTLLDDLSEIDILRDTEDVFGIFGLGMPHHGHGHGRRPGHHSTTNLTVYQAIQASNYTKKFAALINDYPDMVDLLNSTKTNVTAFIPIDKAFEKIPDHGDHKPPKEFIQKIIDYHVLPGYYPAGRVLAHHTLPTALKSEALGGRPQRVRASVGLFGLRLNFYSKVVGANLVCTLPPFPTVIIVSRSRSLSMMTSRISTNDTVIVHQERHLPCCRPYSGAAATCWTSDLTIPLQVLNARVSCC